MEHANEQDIEEMKVSSMVEGTESNVDSVNDVIVEETGDVKPKKVTKERKKTTKKKETETESVIQNVVSGYGDKGVIGNIIPDAKIPERVVEGDEGLVYQAHGIYCHNCCLSTCTCPDGPKLEQTREEAEAKGHCDCEKSCLERDSNDNLDEDEKGCNCEFCGKYTGDDDCYCEQSVANLASMGLPDNSESVETDFENEDICEFCGSYTSTGDDCQCELAIEERASLDSMMDKHFESNKAPEDVRMVKCSMCLKTLYFSEFENHKCDDAEALGKEMKDVQDKMDREERKRSIPHPEMREELSDEIIDGPVPENVVGTSIFRKRFHDNEPTHIHVIDGVSLAFFVKFKVRIHKDIMVTAEENVMFQQEMMDFLHRMNGRLSISPFPSSKNFNTMIIEFPMVDKVTVNIERLEKHIYNNVQKYYNSTLDRTVVFYVSNMLRLRFDNRKFDDYVNGFVFAGTTNESRFVETDMLPPRDKKVMLFINQANIDDADNMSIKKLNHKICDRNFKIKSYNSDLTMIHDERDTDFWLSHKGYSNLSLFRIMKLDGGIIKYKRITLNQRLMRSRDKVTKKLYITGISIHMQEHPDPKICPPIEVPVKDFLLERVYADGFTKVIKDELLNDEIFTEDCKIVQETFITSLVCD